MKINSLTQTFGKKTLYSVDKDGNIQKFNSGVELAQTYGVSKQQVANSLKKSYLIEGRAITDEKQLFNENGTINQEKLEELRKKAAKHRIYAKHTNGTIEKFETIEDAHKSIGISTTEIIRRLSGYYPKKNCIRFYRAPKVEKKDENGNINVVITDTTTTSPNKHKVFVIDSFGRYQEYDSPNDVAKALNISLSYVYSNIQGKNRANFAIVKASDIVKGDEIDPEKIDEFKKTISNKEVLVVDALLNKTKYKNLRQIRTTTPLKTPNTLSKGAVILDNILFIPYAKVVEVDSENNLKVDNQKLLEAFRAYYL
ncbi:hypothetical protein IJ670_05060 [bacterium]|nr:hypothetical protein [bacterium]